MLKLKPSLNEEIKLSKDKHNSTLIRKFIQEVMKELIIVDEELNSSWAW